MRFGQDTLVNEIWSTKREINLFHFFEQRIQRCDRHLGDKESWERMFNKTLEEGSFYLAQSGEVLDVHEIFGRFDDLELSVLRLELCDLK